MEKNIIRYMRKGNATRRDIVVLSIDLAECYDYKSLDDPEGYVIERGGYIVMARADKQIIGTCALCISEYPQFDYELAKMAVSPAAQGKGIGKLLGLDIIREARKRGGATLFLESNRILTPAIGLYRRLGFTEVEGFKSLYARSNIQMSMKL